MILENRNSTSNSTQTAVKCLAVYYSRDLFVCLHIGKGLSRDLVKFWALSNFLSVEGVQEKDFSQLPSYELVSLTILNSAVANIRYMLTPCAY